MVCAYNSITLEAEKEEERRSGLEHFYGNKQKDPNTIPGIYRVTFSQQPEHCGDWEITAATGGLLGFAVLPA